MTAEAGVLLDAIADAWTSAWAKVNQADRIYREIRAVTWPASPEATAAIGRAEAYLLGELDVRQRLVAEEMGWSEFDPDLEWFDGDPQEAAISIQADRCLEAARALLARLREYQGRQS